MCAALTERCLGSVSDGFLVLAGPTACGRVLVVMSGSFADTEPERGRSGQRAASEKPDGQVWVDCGCPSDATAIISLLSATDLPTASAGRFVTCADRPPPWTSLRAALRPGIRRPGVQERKKLQRTENDRMLTMTACATPLPWRKAQRYCPTGASS